MANNNVISARYSAINTMHHCQYCCWQIYKNKETGYKNSFAQLGIAVHNTIEEYSRKCNEQALDTDFDLLQELSYKQESILSESQLADYRQIIDVVKSNMNWNAINSASILEIERRFYLDKDLNATTDKDNAYFSGAIDIVYGDDETLYIEDYKTLRIIYTKSYMKESLQRKIYVLLVAKHFPQVQNFKFAFNFVRHGYKTNWIENTIDDIADLESEIKNEIEALYNLINSDEAPDPTPGGYCQLCPIGGKCKAYKNAFDDVERVENEDDAKALYEHYLLGKMRVKRMEDLLKFYIENNGPIRLKHEEYGPKVYDKIEFTDNKKLIQFLFKECKVPEEAIYETLMSISNTNLKKIIKKFKLKNFEEKIYALAEKSQYTKMVSQKIEEEPDSEDDDGYLEPYL